MIAKFIAALDVFLASSFHEEFESFLFLFKSVGLNFKSFNFRINRFA
jgi:hypothetical protein